MALPLRSALIKTRIQKKLHGLERQNKKLQSEKEQREAAQEKEKEKRELALEVSQFE